MYCSPWVSESSGIPEPKLELALGVVIAGVLVIDGAGKACENRADGIIVFEDKQIEHLQKEPESQRQRAELEVVRANKALAVHERRGFNQNFISGGNLFGYW
jgi:hypothetical protein